MKIVLVLICTLAEQFHVHKSYKTRESTMSCNGNFEENIDLSHIYLAVTVNLIQSCKQVTFYAISCVTNNIVVYCLSLSVIYTLRLKVLTQTLQSTPHTERSSEF